MVHVTDRREKELRRDRKFSRALETAHLAVPSRIADLRVRHRRLDRPMTEMVSGEVDIFPRFGYVDGSRVP